MSRPPSPSPLSSSTVPSLRAPEDPQTDTVRTAQRSWPGETHPESHPGLRQGPFRARELWKPLAHSGSSASARDVGACGEGCARPQPLVSSRHFEVLLSEACFRFLLSDLQGSGIVVNQNPVNALK